MGALTMGRTQRQARLDAEAGVRAAHPGKAVRFGEPAADGEWVRVPYSVPGESGESFASVDDDSGAHQVFRE